MVVVYLYFNGIDLLSRNTINKSKKIIKNVKKSTEMLPKCNKMQKKKNYTFTV